MKLTNTNQLISFCAAFSLIGAVANAKKPEEQAGYDKSKDLGVKAPDGADTPFDGTMKSVKKNWEMWPNKEMDITWKIMDIYQSQRLYPKLSHCIWKIRSFI